MNLKKQISPEWILLVIVGLFFSFVLPRCIAPRKNFSHYIPPKIPDYSNENNWAALPTKKDSADAVPANSGLKDGQADAKVDVFFIHPTMYYHGKSWNADIYDQHTNHLVDIYPIREQASVFNESCKIYAPRYRQATLYSFFDGKGNGDLALDTAYTDIKRAFEYYLKNYNHGRPIIIAGHSQGTFLAQRLLHDFFDNDPKLKKLLVAAYLIGGNVSEKSFSTLVPCDSASETNCYVAWHSRKYGSDFNAPVKSRACAPGYQNCTNYVCVNPLTWKRDTAYAPASLNLGSVPSTFNRIDKGMADAKVSPQEIIWTHVSKPGYPKGTNYHVADYSLFWMNIRANVKVRCEEYLKKNQ
jgi:pimeloyl-ACP methyl ester carboxylesterase